MAFPTFTPPGVVGLAPGTSVDYEPRVLEASFGDGYSQRQGDGINAISEKVSVIFDNLTRTEANMILAFFADRAGYKPFKFTLPGEVTPKQFICKKWAKTYTFYNVQGISAEFTQNFDPEV